MAGLILKVFPAGPLLTNNYLIFNEESKRGFIIDLSSSSGELFSFLEKQGIVVNFVALTHAHFDHIAGLENTEFPFYLHKNDSPLLGDPAINGSSFFSEPIKINKSPCYYQEKLKFEDFEIKIIESPGHTPGSVALKIGDWLFTGDTLFYQSIGRTDIPLACGDLLLDSIQKKIMVLPDSTLIYPGHGPSSSLGYEKKNNPFLLG